MNVAISSVKTDPLLADTYQKAISHESDESVEVHLVCFLLQYVSQSDQEDQNTCSHGRFDPLCTISIHLGHRFSASF